MYILPPMFMLSSTDHRGWYHMWNITDLICADSTEVMQIQSTFNILELCPQINQAGQVLQVPVLPGQNIPIYTHCITCLWISASTGLGVITLKEIKQQLCMNCGFWEDKIALSIFPPNIHLSSKFGCLVGFCSCWWVFFGWLGSFFGFCLFDWGRFIGVLL